MKQKIAWAFVGVVMFPILVGVVLDWLNPTDLVQNRLIMVFTGIALSLFAALVGARFLTKRLVDLAEVSQKVAEGDLSQTVRVETGDEVGVLAGSLRTMMERLRDMVRQIQTSTPTSASVITGPPNSRRSRYSLWTERPTSASGGRNAPSGCDA